MGNTNHLVSKDFLTPCLRMQILTLQPKASSKLLCFPPLLQVHRDFPLPVRLLHDFILQCLKGRQHSPRTITFQVQGRYSPEVLRHGIATCKALRNLPAQDTSV